MTTTRCHQRQAHSSWSAPLLPWNPPILTPLIPSHSLSFPLAGTGSGQSLRSFRVLKVLLIISCSYMLFSAGRCCHSPHWSENWRLEFRVSQGGESGASDIRRVCGVQSRWKGMLINEEKRFSVS